MEIHQHILLRYAGVDASGTTMVERKGIGFTYDVEKVIDPQSNTYALIVLLLV